ncbi:MAG: RNase adapter RapZ [Lachnospiraceae bacterium]|nr:RNase adapter RapZ [Lachnospiraceae bacterium]
MRFVIVTGISGAGKSTTMRILEDAGFFCVDNLPVQFVEKFYELARAKDDSNKVAVGIDVRSGSGLYAIGEIIDNINKDGKNCEILFMDASNETLVKRYKETRRIHPLTVEGNIEEAIAAERKELAFLKKRADYILNTDTLITKDVKAEIEKIFIQDKAFSNIYVTVMSFGFKYGVPRDADLVFDVRFMPNPYYVDELRKKTGMDKEVNDYVMNSKESHEFVNKLDEMIEFLIPNYIKEGKTQLVIAIGCTGGKHRSITVAKHLYENLKSIEEYGVKLINRDIDR